MVYLLGLLKREQYSSIISQALRKIELCILTFSLVLPQSLISCFLPLSLFLFVSIPRIHFISLLHSRSRSLSWKFPFSFLSTSSNYSLPTSLKHIVPSKPVMALSFYLMPPLSLSLSGSDFIISPIASSLARTATKGLP